MRLLLQLTIISTLRSFGTWRWLLVPGVFTIAGFLCADDVSFDYTQQVERSVNTWDVIPVMLSNPFYLAWVFVLGFTLLVGDTLQQERNDGMLALIISRSSSRILWWNSKCISIAILSLCYIIIAVIMSMLGAVLAGIPFELTDSLSSQATWTMIHVQDWYPRIFDVSMPWFVFFISLYTAFTLWIIANIIIVVSFLFQHTFVPFATIAVWMISSFVFSPALEHIPGAQMLDVRYFVTYTKHFDAFFVYTPSLPMFLFIAIVLLMIVLSFGILRLHYLDI
ncbi:MAG: hypothetical protein GFH27_549285n300 [Chloroflexi bacterium AL-W]|nr:hypothetical protein [Chloroflexi bacterium AL-N1]NOK65812.1 hypothetical protein [Chloroflexi bacterium AL-N10]NOK74247.1 hypothetical protein [Chloroflexi bacterium AL-N5]NOK80845.1 hypothetical protein [Chloroflexi bacterium AL-W]NOK88505.1 hypothetical protein [Chloroflexi bacterium AL-N15]